MGEPDVHALNETLKLYEEYLNLLNEDGKTRAREYINYLASLEEYRK